MQYFDRLALLEKRKGESAHARRICAEIRFLAYASAARGGVFDGQIEKVAAELLERADAEGTVSRSAVQKAEDDLLCLQPEVKKYRIYLVAHAHIDMNWLWGYGETAAVTVSTFRTMLALMNRYPEFRFSQSQASMYKIVEDYAPELLSGIAERVREGRWEISASTWVENDENMPGCESLIRQVLYTKKYLKKLFPGASAPKIDFAPDTFGHNASMPDICAQTGVSWFYHCRGNDGAQTYYRWRGNGGGELLCYCDPYWYSAGISDDLFDRVPGICEKYGVPVYLTVYGVGDHGGGPSAEDIERILEYRSWPLMPTLLFGSYREFFEELETYRAQLPVIAGECNFVFSGCYTSKSEIKRENALAQARLNAAETLSAMAGIFVGAKDDSAIFENAYRKLLFLQFHDILPGSGVKQTGDGASGEYQKIVAAASCRADAAMRSIASKLSLPFSVSEIQGGGAGYRSAEALDGSLSTYTAAGGKKRAYVLFNTLAQPFSGLCRISVWNWPYDPSRAVFTDEQGKDLGGVLSEGSKGYWGNEVKTFSVFLTVPALGYTTIFLDESPRTRLPGIGGFGNRVLSAPGKEILLSNDRISAVFERKSGKLLSLTDIASGKTHSVNGCFRFLLEDARAGMQAWKEGPIVSLKELTDRVLVCEESHSALSSAVSFEVTFGNDSVLKARYVLDRGSDAIRCETSVRFYEKGDGVYTPRLEYALQCAPGVGSCRYGAPIGTIDRPALGHDVPAIFACPQAGEERMPALFAVGKYGFRFDQDVLSLTLLRASAYPDPLPEYGTRESLFFLALCEPTESALEKAYDQMVYAPVVCPATGNGTLAPSASLLKEPIGARIIACKRAEDHNGYIFRLLSTQDRDAEVEIGFSLPLKAAKRCSACEEEWQELQAIGGTVRVRLKAYEPYTLYVAF